MTSKSAIAEKQDVRICQFIRTQRSVKLWIEEVLNIKDKLDEDLFKSLKSGVILCYLMLEIEDRSIPRIQESILASVRELWFTYLDTDAPFKLKENINFFLSAVRDYGVPPHKAFHPNDLWDNKGIVLVVECLATLAQIAASKTFPISLPLVKEEGEWTNESIIKRLTKEQKADLSSQLAKIKEQPTGGKRPKVSEAIVRRKLAYLAGNGIDLTQLDKKFSKFQALWRGHKARKLYQKRVRDQAYRDNVAKEILSTEQVYVRNLEVCIRVFLNPLKDAIAKKKAIIDDTQLRAIFSDIEIIYGFNKKLLSDLEPIVAHWSPHQCLGKIFLKILDFLKIYRGYIQNFNNSLAVLGECRKKQAFEKFLIEGKDNPDSNKLELSAFLITPVQRIPRYNLLLRDLAKHTWEDHMDFDALKQAVARVEEIAFYMNEKKREAENMASLLDLEQTLYGKDVPRIANNPQRFLLRKTEFTTDTGKVLILYLFTDMILFGKTDTKKKILKTLHLNTEMVKCKDHALLNDMEVVDLSESTFEIWKTVPKKHKLYVLTTKTPSEKAQWMGEYTSNMNKAKEKQEIEQRKQESKREKKEEAKPDVKGAEATLRERRTMRTNRNSKGVTDKSSDTTSTPSSSSNSTPSGSPLDTRKDPLDPAKRKQELIDRKETINVQLRGLVDMLQPKDRKSKGSSQQQEFAVRLLLEMTAEWTQVEKELAALESREPQSIQDVAPIPNDIVHDKGASEEKRKSKKLEDKKEKKRGTKVLKNRKTKGGSDEEAQSTTSATDKE